LARQQQPQPRPRPTDRFVHYDRSEFGGNFDAEVDAGSRTVTIIIAVDFTPAGGASRLDEIVQQIPKFKADLQSVVEGAWSNQYGLKSGCTGEVWHTRFRILYGAKNPHATIYLHPDTPGGRSNAGEEAGEGAANLQISDTEYKVLALIENDQCCSLKVTTLACSG